MRVAVLAVLLLAGCATGPNWDAVHAQADKIAQQCMEKRLKGYLPDKAASVRCASPGILELYAGHGWPYMDLLQYERAQLLAIMEREDRGEFTEAQADAAFAEVLMRVNSEIENRRAADAMQRTAMIRAFQAMQPPQPVTCTTFGATTTCR